MDEGFAAFRSMGTTEPPVDLRHAPQVTAVLAAQPVGQAVLSRVVVAQRDAKGEPEKTLDQVVQSRLREVMSATRAAVAVELVPVHDVGGSDGQHLADAGAGAGAGNSRP
jgi:hypothetical protein